MARSVVSQSLRPFAVSIVIRRVPSRLEFQSEKGAKGGVARLGELNHQPPLFGTWNSMVLAADPR